jgi:hypothetical protein
MNRLSQYFSDQDEQYLREIAKDIIQFCLVMYRVHVEAGEFDCAQCLCELEAKAASFLLRSLRSH